MLLVLAACVTTSLSAQQSLQSHSVTLAAANDEWTSTGLKVAPGDLVIVFVEGRIKAGGFVGEVDANGRDRNGADVKLGFVEGKIATGNPFRVGQRFPFQADAPGTLKLRVADSRYDDNSGSYSATIVLIPGAMVPAPTPFTPEE